MRGLRSVDPGRALIDDYIITYPLKVSAKLCSPLVKFHAIFFHFLPRADLLLPERGGHRAQPVRLVAAAPRGEDHAHPGREAAGERHPRRSLPQGAPLHHPREEDGLDCVL